MYVDEHADLYEAMMDARTKDSLQTQFSDANWLNAHGIPTVTLGCGQMNIHTTSEMLDLAAFRDACRVALWLATSG